MVVTRSRASRIAEPVTLGDETSIVRSVAFSPDGWRLLAGGFDGTLGLWDITSGVRLWKRAHGDPVTEVAFSADGTRVATASSRGSVLVFEAATGQRPLELMHAPEVHGVAFSPDGARLATAGGDGTARIWDAVTGEQLLEVDARVRNPEDGEILVDAAVDGLAFSPDGRRLVTASGSGLAHVWDAVSGDRRLEVEADSYLTGVGYSPDGTRFATAGGNGKVQIWDGGTGDEVLRLRHGRLPWRRPLAGVTFSPDGRRLATAGWDRTARIWDTATGHELLEVHHRDWVTGVAFSPDGRRLATASGEVQIWDVDLGEAVFRRVGTSRLWPVLKTAGVGLGLLVVGFLVAWLVFFSGFPVDDTLWGVGGAVAIGVGLLLVHPVEEYEWGAGAILVGALALAAAFVPE